jgi:hypothetical protein
MTRIASDPTRVVELPLGLIESVQAIVLALDPGKTTGYAYYLPWSGNVTCGQLGPNGHHRDLMELIDMLAHIIRDDPDTPEDCPLEYWPISVVYEQFEFRQNDEAIRGALRKYVARLKRGDIKSLRAIVDALEDIVEIWPGRDGLELISREYIGVAKLATQTHANVKIYSQSASDAKSFVKDNKLKALDWYRLTVAMPHARDALRHLLKHLVSTRNVEGPITTAWRNSG